MSRIRAKDTGIELLVRRELHRRGLRFRLHRKDLPGRPDLTLASHRTVVFVNGCFWHLHECRLSKVPASNRDFWLSKLTANRERDARNLKLLHDGGWRVATVWECAVRDQTDRAIERSMDRLARFIRSDRGSLLDLVGN